MKNEELKRLPLSLENILIQGNQYAGVIDFDQSNRGDPFYDFYKLSLFSRESSLPYSAGHK
ncbi:phosphotransferase [Bacillus sp. FJAT-53060]|uniref:phosphotransferase n=1 Tax=Bacillus TaxID=1386 RepID=UPI001CFA7D33|nr:phosphotransferase [Bacillus stratosphericus]